MVCIGCVSFLSKILSGIAPKCQTVWIEIRLKKIVRSDLDPNSLERLSADDRSQ